MPAIKARTTRRHLVRHRRPHRESNETLFSYATFIGEATEYVLNQLVETVLARDRDFHAWRPQLPATHARKSRSRRNGRARAFPLRHPTALRRHDDHYITEGFASSTQTVLAAPSEAAAIARALELLAGAEDGESFVRTFAYTSGPAYGLLLDAVARGWTRTVRGSDDPVALLMRALGVQLVANAVAAAARYGGASSARPKNSASSSGRHGS